MGNRRGFPFFIILGLLGLAIISASPSTGRTTDFDSLRKLQVDENEADNEEVDVETPSGKKRQDVSTGAGTGAGTGAESDAQTSSDSASMSNSAAEAASITGAKVHTKIATKSNARSKAAANVKTFARADTATKVSTEQQGPTYPTSPTKPTTAPTTKTTTTRPPTTPTHKLVICPYPVRCPCPCPCPCPCRPPCPPPCPLPCPPAPNPCPPPPCPPSYIDYDKRRLSRRIRVGRKGMRKTRKLHRYRPSGAPE